MAKLFEHSQLAKLHTLISQKGWPQNIHFKCNQHLHCVFCLQIFGHNECFCSSVCFTLCWCVSQCCTVGNGSWFLTLIFYSRSLGWKNLDSFSPMGAPLLYNTFVSRWAVWEAKRHLPVHGWVFSRPKVLQSLDSSILNRITWVHHDSLCWRHASAWKFDRSQECIQSTKTQEMQGRQYHVICALEEMFL